MEDVVFNQLNVLDDNTLDSLHNWQRSIECTANQCIKFALYVLKHFGDSEAGVGSYCALSAAKVNAYPRELSSQTCCERNQSWPLHL